MHRAILKDGTQVAVQIIHPSLRNELASDFAVFKNMGAQIQPGGFDLQWIAKVFETALAKELDFEGEGMNAELCEKQLSYSENVKERLGRVCEHKGGWKEYVHYEILGLWENV